MANATTTPETDPWSARFWIDDIDLNIAELRQRLDLLDEDGADGFYHILSALTLYLRAADRTAQTDRDLTERLDALCDDIYDTCFWACEGLE